MVAPAPVIRKSSSVLTDDASAVLIGGAKTTKRFLRTFGFHVLAVLLGIALAFMSVIK